MLSMFNYTNVLSQNLLQMGTFTILTTTEWGGHSLKLQLCIFEKSHVKHNNLDCHFFGEINSIIPKVSMFKI